MEHERLSSEHWSTPLARYDHVSRYEWICRFTPGCHVIEAACGTGYGSEIIIRRGSPISLQGFDLSLEAVEAAKQICGALPNVRFDTASVVHLPLGDHCCDVYVSFETIEHVPDDKAMIWEAARVLRKGGKFICSTPNRALSYPGQSISYRPHNSYHLREYTRGELAELLRETFSDVQWFGQRQRGRVYSQFLSAVGCKALSVARNIHLARKLCGRAFWSRRFHWPQPLLDDRQPEVIIAICTAR